MGGGGGGIGGHIWCIFIEETSRVCKRKRGRKGEPIEGRRRSKKKEENEGSKCAEHFSKLFRNIPYGYGLHLYIGNVQGTYHLTRVYVLYCITCITCIPDVIYV